MCEYKLREESSIKCISAKGRIDALTAPDIQKIFDDLILTGERIILVDMASVNYVSSAGLRAFVITQKKLKKAGGEIILLHIADSIFEIFRISGLTNVFRIAANIAEIPGLFLKKSDNIGTITREINGIAITYTEKGAGKGTLSVVGTQDKTKSSSYNEEDVVAISPAERMCGCGLATLGERYEEYKNLFGESMVINGNFFFYPAVKQSSVDFQINTYKDPDITYKFLNGFVFNGPYRYTLSFQSKDRPVDLRSLIGSFFSISRADMLGVVIIAESKGLWGMHIKRVPINEQKPANNRGIFDKENFSDWMDFPVEPTYINHIIVGTGIAVRDRTILGPERQSIISEGSNFHIHGGIFDKAPIGRDAGEFDKEMMRLFNDLQVYKIQHILGKSRFSGGLATIIELEG